MPEFKKIMHEISDNEVTSLDVTAFKEKISKPQEF